MNRSDQTDKLFASLAQFQGEVTNPPRDASNPYFKSRYTQLDVMIDHVRPILAKHGLSVIQMPCSNDGGAGVITTLCHASGQYIQSDPYYLRLAKQDAQAGGSAITYARRYSFAAILGIASDTDDDGNGASKTPEPPGENKPPASQEESKKPTGAPKAGNGLTRADRINRLCSDHKVTMDVVSAIVDMLTKSGAIANKYTKDMTDIEFDVMMLAVTKELMDGRDAGTRRAV